MCCSNFLFTIQSPLSVLGSHKEVIVEYNEYNEFCIPIVHSGAETYIHNLKNCIMYIFP